MAGRHLLRLILLYVLASPAHALEIGGIPVNQPFNYIASVQGECLSATGLACGWREGDALLDPTTGLVANPLPSGVTESPQWTRDAIYTATGIDPGALIQAAKVDASPSNINGTAGLTLYDDAGNVLLDENIGNNGYMQGFWSYAGNLVLDYLVVKPGKQAIVWDIDELTIGGPNDSNPSTLLVGFWELNSAYEVLTGFRKNEMSHISVYSIEPGTDKPSTDIPIPPSLWLVASLAVLILRRTRQA